MAISHIVDDIIPAREIHLIAGPSGAGKTTLLFQIIDDWRQGRDVLGHKSHPQPFCYVACDRTLASTKRTLKRVGIMEGTIPTLSLAERRDIVTIGGVVAAAKIHVEGVRVLFIDAIAVLVREGRTNDYAVVADFLRECAQICAREDITIIALVHAAKVKEGEKFLNPRQRILGSVAWAGFSDTVILIEPATPEDATSDERTVLILPRNAPAEELAMGFNQEGRLEIRQIDELVSDLLTKRVLPAMEPDRVYHINEIWTMAADRGIKTSRKTVQRWLAWQIEAGKIEMVKRGHYKRTTVQ